MKAWLQLIWQFLGVIILASGMAGCAPRSASGGSTTFSSTAQVARGNMAQVVQLSGQVLPTEAREVGFSIVGGRVHQVLVQPGQTVSEGDPLVTLDIATKERERREALAELRVAEVALEAARREASEEAIIKAEADLARREAELAVARFELDVAEQLGTAMLQDKVAEAQAALQDARDQWALAELSAHQSTIRTLEYQQAFFQRALRDLKPGEDATGIEEGLATTARDLAAARAAREETLRKAREAVTKAEGELQKARADLERAISGEVDLTATARLAYERAVRALEEAQRKAASLKLGPDSAILNAAQIAYDAALAKVERIEAEIEASMLRAPIQGVVFDVFVQPGSWIQPGERAVYLADPRALRIKAQASEVDVPHVQVGQKVRITFDAAQSIPLSGEVLSISPRGQSFDGLTVYEVETSIEQGTANVLPGMLANVRVLVGERVNVLLVPAAAVRFRYPIGNYVSVHTADGKIEDRPVEVGMSDGIMAEVLSGVREGETISIPLILPQSPGQSGAPGPEPVPGGDVPPEGEELP